MKTLIKIVLFGAALLWLCGWAFDNTIKYVQASELDFQFGNPAFSGNGYGTHVLSVDQVMLMHNIQMVIAFVTHVKLDLKKEIRWKLKK